MMGALFAPLAGGFYAEIRQLSRSRLFVALTIIQAVTFLFLVSLFGMTGSRAPTAIITHDKGPYAKQFIDRLAVAHNSFDLRFMDQATAEAALNKGDIVAIIVIPADFSDALSHGRDTAVQVTIDNVNTDMTEDIKRALPSAITAFGNQAHFPNIRVQAQETDLIDHETGFIEYLVVSGLSLDAFVIASILSAMAVAREFESGTVKLLAVAPVQPLLSILGRVLATNLIATAAMIFPVAVAVFGYRIIPRHPAEMIGVLLLSIIIFSCVGVALGAVLKRTLPVASLVFGISLPLYLCSSSLEPERFDGNIIWVIAHISPVYYSVGILEQAVYDLRVTPEPVSIDFLALLGYALVMLLLAGVLLRTVMMEKSATRQQIEEQPKVKKAGIWRKPSLIPNRNWTLAMSTLPLLLLLGGGVWLNTQQSLTTSALVEREISAPALSTDQQQETLLTSYIDNVSSMIINDKLLSARKDNPLKTLATARTQETLKRLDPARKAVLLRFLYKSRLIDDAYHIVNLSGADLTGVQCVGCDLRDTNMKGANFRSADLRDSVLMFALLDGADLSGADLRGADLRGATLTNVKLDEANLAGADLRGVHGLSDNQLSNVHSLAGTTLPDGSVVPGDDDDDEDAGD